MSLDRVQRSGVRTEPVQARVLVRPVRAVGTVAIDERRATIVTMRSDGYVEDLFVNTTGQHVRAGEPLFRVYSPDIQQAISDLLVTKNWSQRGPAEAGSGKSLDGTMQRLRNLGLSEDRIREIRDSGSNPRTIDWLAPAGGTVIVKRIINGQRVVAGDELYRIVDLSNVWVIADVAEGDLADIKLGTRASVTFRAYRNQPVDGVVTFIYPEVRTETRTVRVRIEVANPDERLKPDMYADVVFHADAGEASVTTVPLSAIIDNGTRQIVLVAKGEGRFEPRPVKLGRRSDGHVEIVDGLKPGEEIVTTATFLIDAESNLQTALKTFTEQEPAKMIAAVIRWSARNLLLVGFAGVFLTLAGLYAVSRVPLDAIPDLSDVQVIVYTEFPGQAPQVVEDQVTYPLTTAMLSVPKSRVVRGFSFFGVSFRLRDLRGRHGSVLGALARARISQFGRPPAAGRRRAEPRAGRDRRRLGLSIRRARCAKEPGGTAHDPGLVHPLRPRQGGGRRRGRQRRRLRQAIQRGDRSAPAAVARHPVIKNSRCDCGRAISTSAAAPSNWPKPNSSCAGAATSRASPISSRSSSRATKACRYCCATSPASNWRRTSGAASPN